MTTSIAAIGTKPEQTVSNTSATSFPSAEGDCATIDLSQSDSFGIQLRSANAIRPKMATIARIAHPHPRRRLARRGIDADRTSLPFHPATSSLHKSVETLLHKCVVRS